MSEVGITTPNDSEKPHALVAGTNIKTTLVQVVIWSDIFDINDFFSHIILLLLDKLVRC